VISTGRRPGTQEGEMNMNWLSMIGGGITAAATLAVGISTSGILAANPTSEDLAPAAGETIYVEQPVIEVPSIGDQVAATSTDPIVIAILPAPSETEPTPAPDPSMPTASYEDGDEYVDDEDGEYEDEYDDEDEYEDEDEHDDEDEDEYEDEGPEEGDDD
jgi:hypothetical protein